MNTSTAILTTLSDSGPAEICELHAVISHRSEFDQEPRAREHVELELHGLIRQDRVKVECGIYQLKGE